MVLSPREKDKLMLFSAAQLAERRKARGLKLNYPEAVALISFEIIEGARDGKTVAELMAYGQTLLGRDDVMEGIDEMLYEVQVEATFPDGTKLVTVHEPIVGAAGDMTDGEGVMSHDTRPEDYFIPGEIIIGEGDIEINQGRETRTVSVANTGDRPIQVGSHYHFYETNRGLLFDRKKTRGFRLNIAAGTAVRFEPGQTREVELVAFAGDRRVYGFNGQVMGDLDKPTSASREE